MQIIFTIFSGLTLLIATVSLVLTIHEKNHSRKCSAAAIQYADQRAKAVLSEIHQAYDGRIEKLEQGITPDYEQAKAAANAVNDFNRGISNILGFDPMSALQKQRNPEAEP